MAIASLLSALHPLHAARGVEGTEVTVFAAASLTEAFQALGRNFEAAHTGTRIRFNFGGSQQLVQQIVQGAQADMFASADWRQMRAAISAGVIDTNFIAVVARNRLVVILPPDNPGRVGKLSDIANPGVKIVFADPAVPVGQYAVQFLGKCAGKLGWGETFRDKVVKNVVSYEENVRIVLGKVQLGECDAGIVYTSDIALDTLHRVRHVEIPDSLNVIAEYPAALVRGMKTRQAAGEFLAYILSDEGGRVLSAFGFMAAQSRAKK